MCFACLRSETQGFWPDFPPKKYQRIGRDDSGHPLYNHVTLPDKAQAWAGRGHLALDPTRRTNEIAPPGGHLDGQSAGLNSQP